MRAFDRCYLCGEVVEEGVFAVLRDVAIVLHREHVHPWVETLLAAAEAVRGERDRTDG